MNPPTSVDDESSPIDDIETRTLDAEHTAVHRRRVSAEELPSWLSGVYGTIATHLQRIGVPSSGPPFARFHDRSDSVDVEAGYFVTERVTRHDEVEPSMLPAGPAAVVWHRGDPHALDRPIGRLEAWCEQQGVAPAGPAWAVFHQDPDQLAGPQEALTEVVQPYETA